MESLGAKSSKKLVTLTILNFLLELLPSNLLQTVLSLEEAKQIRLLLCSIDLKSHRTHGLALSSGQSQWLSWGYNLLHLLSYCLKPFCSQEWPYDNLMDLN